MNHFLYPQVHDLTDAQIVAGGTLLAPHDHSPRFLIDIFQNLLRGEVV